MKTIEISGGIKTTVDEVDFEMLSTEFKWWLHRDESHPLGYVQGKHQNSGKILYMHRVIAERRGDRIDGFLIDHRDMNTLDNRRSNLRIATRSESQWNKKTYRNNKSGYKGVCWAKDRSLWVVQLAKNGRQVFRAYFKHLPDAAQASMLLLYVEHGEFSRLS